MDGAHADRRPPLLALLCGLLLLCCLPASGQLKIYVYPMRQYAKMLQTDAYVASNMYGLGECDGTACAFGCV